MDEFGKSLKVSYQLNLTTGVTPLSHAIYHLHMIIFWICIGIGIVVFSFLFYAIIYHRKSKGAKAAQFHTHFRLEMAWSIIPFIILALMAIPATKVLIQIRNTDKPDLTIKITGFQWKWKYEYLDSGIQFFSNTTTPFAQIHGSQPKDQDYLLTVDHPLVIPIHKKVRFLVTSNDVIHSWWVPDFGTKQDAIPGFIIEAWTRVNKPGTYHGRCAELCGMNHAYMPIVVEALTEKDFAAWVIQQKTGVAPPATSPAVISSEKNKALPVENKSETTSLASIMQKGQQIFNTTCAVCHQLTGEGLPPTFPALKGSPIATGPVEQHIHRVAFGKPGTAMQAFKDQLTDEEIAAVITYERNAWGNNKGDIVMPADVAAIKAKG